LNGSGTGPHPTPDDLDGAMRDVVHEAVVVADPLDFIARGAAARQYDPAAASIAQRLGEATDADDLERIIAEEFARWFAPADARATERYAAVARSVWRSKTLILGDQA